MRLPAGNQGGSVDISTLPQTLMSRVDVVTGGASSVYGSDAITGVVNFILDKNFTGIKYDANAGISRYGDGFKYKAQCGGGHRHFRRQGPYRRRRRLSSMATASCSLPGPSGAEDWAPSIPAIGNRPGHQYSQRRPDGLDAQRQVSAAASCSVNGYEFGTARHSHPYHFRHYPRGHRAPSQAAAMGAM